MNLFKRKTTRRDLRVESLESRQLLSTVSTDQPIVDAAPSPSTATFIDPTAIIGDSSTTTFGIQDYVGPFATFRAKGGATISIGDASNVQDNVIIKAAGRNASVVVGDHAILAHGATVIGPATIGAPGGSAAFVGFNAVIDGATVEPGAMVTSLAKVAPGIVIRTGFKVLPGMYITTQAQADQPSLGKVAAVSDEDIAFMNGVVHVNETLAAGYSQQAIASPGSVRGIGPNPPAAPFNPISLTPTLAGVPTMAPRFRGRIIGDVRMINTGVQLRKVIGHDDSIRADEATPFVIGRIAAMANRVTIHGLENSQLASGHGDSFGFHSVVHGGEDSGQAPQDTTIVGSGVRIGAWDVVFRSTIGNRCVIGPYAYIEGSTLPPGTVVPRGAIIINNQYLGRVQSVYPGPTGYA
jgi:carbonic anhydrase/acetyltransferase-like protein (isoleucine patch superfamily)